jgi:hypothetical protein
MVEPNKQLLADERIPRVTLAEQEWPIPRLATEQNVEIFPLLAPRLDLFMEVIKTQSIAVVTAEVLRDFAGAVYWALTRAHTITRAEFNAMPIVAVEIMRAMHVVALQSGLFKRAETNGVHRPLAPTAASHPNGTSKGSPPRSARAPAGRGTTLGR